MSRRTWPEPLTAADFPPGLPDPAGKGAWLQGQDTLSQAAGEGVEASVGSGQGHRHLVLENKFSLALQVAGKNGETGTGLRSCCEEHLSCRLRSHTAISTLSFAHLYAVHRSSEASKKV